MVFFSHNARRYRQQIINNKQSHGSREQEHGRLDHDPGPGKGGHVEGPCGMTGIMSIAVQGIGFRHGKLSSKAYVTHFITSTSRILYLTLPCASRCTTRLTRSWMHERDTQTTLISVSRFLSVYLPPHFINFESFNSTKPTN